MGELVSECVSAVAYRESRNGEDKGGPSLVTCWFTISGVSRGDWVLLIVGFIFSYA